MTHQPPIDRVRDREEDGLETFDDARENYSQKEASLQREGPQDAPIQESEGDFKEHMNEKLKESGKEDNDSS